jgi:hypothetical protein
MSSTTLFFSDEDPINDHTLHSVITFPLAYRQSPGFFSFLNFLLLFLVFESNDLKTCGNLGSCPVAHTYHPSYSGGRDQEDLGLKPAQANRPYLKKTLH